MISGGQWAQKGLGDALIALSQSMLGEVSKREGEKRDFQNKLALSLLGQPESTSGQKNYEEFLRMTSSPEFMALPEEEKKRRIGEFKYFTGPVSPYGFSPIGQPVPKPEYPSPEETKLYNSAVNRARRAVQKYEEERRKGTIDLTPFEPKKEDLDIIERYQKRF